MAAYFGLLKVNSILVASLNGCFPWNILIFFKVSHVFITGTCIRYLLFPRRFAAIFAVSCSLFALLLGSLSHNISFRLKNANHDFSVFTPATFVIFTFLAISLHCIDALCGSLLQARRGPAQATRKLTSLAGSCVCVSLLLLPNDYFLLPVILFAVCTACLGILTALCWFFMPSSSEMLFKEMHKRSAESRLNASQIGVVIISALVSDNADQILDTVTNIEIDKLVFFGQVK
jgi:hypothetical protein